MKAFLAAAVAFNGGEAPFIGPDPVPAGVGRLAKVDVEAELLRLRHEVFASKAARLQTAALMKVLAVMNGGKLG